MGWLGNGDRRRRARRPYEPKVRSEPTYLVERDAPPAPEHPVPFARRWIDRARAAIARQREQVYDAYPDRARPFEPPAPPGPSSPVDAKAVAARLPRPQRKVRLMVISGQKARVVRVEPFRLDRPDLWTRSFVSVLVRELERTIRSLDDEGQGLAEYALILALVAVVAIVALLVLGDAIAGILSQVGACIPDGCPAPPASPVP